LVVVIGNERPKVPTNALLNRRPIPMRRNEDRWGIVDLRIDDRFTTSASKNKWHKGKKTHDHSSKD